MFSSLVAHTAFNFLVMVRNQSSTDNGSSSALSNVGGWSLMNAAIFRCLLPLSCLLGRFSNNHVYRSITSANDGGGGGGVSPGTRSFPTFCSTSSSPSSCTSSMIRILSSYSCSCPCLRLWFSWLPLFLPTSRLWCNWLFFLMNLPFGGPFIAILNPIRPSFHLLPWNDKDEKTSSGI